MLMEEFKLPGGVRIVLNKHIPVAAGMAGGSSMQRQFCFGMNKMFRLGLSQRSLMERGVVWGSRCSVLYYERNGTGRGNWRGADYTSCTSGVYGTDRKTADQCFYQSGI